MPARTCCLPAAPGARRTAPSPIPSAASRASARSCRRRARRGPTGGSSRRSRGAWASRRPSPIESAADIFREHAALSAFENDGTRDFDLGGLAHRRDDAFDALDPVQWPLCRAASTRDRERRFFADGGFFNAGPQGALRRAGPPPAPRAATSKAFPFRLNTGRVRDQWHTMTRTGLSPRLARTCPSRSSRCIRPTPRRRRSSTAASRGSRPATDRACSRSCSATGSAAARSSCRSTGATRPPPPRASATWSWRHRPLFRPARGQGDAGRDRAGRVRVPRLRLVDARRARGVAWPQPGGRAWLYDAIGNGFATMTGRTGWRACSRRRGRRCGARLSDPREHAISARLTCDGQLVGCLFVGRRAPLPALGLLASLLGRIRSGRSSAKGAARGHRRSAARSGPLICACFGVGLNAIRDAIARRRPPSVAIGEALRAGTNCGSCLPELKRIVP